MKHCVFWMCHCILCLCYTARKAHAPYYIVICGLSGCSIFSTLSHKWHDFRKKLLNIKYMFWFFYTSFVRNLSHSKKNSARCYHKRTYVFLWSTHYSCQILMQLEFPREIFEKSSNIKFHENPSGGSRVVPCGWMNWHEASSRFMHFCESA
jgi:hypothetical protein